MTRPPPRSPLFPYTTLFRSGFDTRSILPAIRAPQADGSTGRRPHSSPTRALTAPVPAQAQSRREPVHSSQPQMVFHFFTFHWRRALKPAARILESRLELESSAG